MLRSVFASLLALSALTASTPAPAADRSVGDLGMVGTVKFPTSCDPAVQADFERGLALLHSFFYEEARRIFAGIAERDPDCAMAQWGIAMSYYHPLWAPPDSADLARGRVAMERALAASKQDERERAYIRAVEAFYRGLDEPAAEVAGAMSCHAPSLADPKGRAACFRREMEKVTTAYSGDLDAAAFFALSLIGTAPPGDPALSNQKQAAGILEAWYAENPHHPGLVHYLIHTYDYPPLAAQGLPAAKAYAAIAPWVPHALHMPSHIFTRVAMWKETIESNLASAKAARDYAAEQHPDSISFDELHALDYLAYAYLQTAQDGAAREVLERIAGVRATYPASDFAAAYALGAVPARYALERRQWAEAQALAIPTHSTWKDYPFGEGHLVYAQAIGAIHAGKLDVAQSRAERLGALVAAMKSPRLKYFADQTELQRQAALGLIAISRGRTEEGLEMLRAVAAREDSLGKHPVSPGALLPVRELYAEALLEHGQAALALAQFEASLRIYPGRFNALYGAGRAAARADQPSVARQYFQTLLTQTQDGDGERPELAEARAYLSP